MSQGSKENLSIVVVGASGDLARRKIYPALFALYCQGCLPEQFQIFGFARSSYSDSDFRTKISENLTCRYTPDGQCDLRIGEFLNRCHYVSGSYDSVDSFLDLFMTMRAAENNQPANRLYYLAIPPSIFLNFAMT